MRNNEKTCRFCLNCLDEFSVNIFEDESGFNLADQINKVLVFRFKDKPPLPRNACLDCVDFLMQLTKFMDLALTSNDTLMDENGSPAGPFDDTTKIENVNPDNSPHGETDISISLQDIDMDSDPDTNDSFLIDTKTTRRLHWPVQSHNKFLKMEKEMLEDEAYAKKLKVYFKKMSHKNINLLFGNDVQERYSYHGKGMLIKISDSPLLMCVANSWINKGNPLVKILQKMNKTFRKRRESAQHFPWPILDHKRFLELEKKMLHDGAFVENLKTFLKEMPHQNIDLLFGYDIQDKYSFSGRGRLLKISDSQLLMCVAKSWTNPTNPMDKVLKNIDKHFFVKRQNESKRKFSAKLRPAANNGKEKETEVQSECTDVDTDVEIYSGADPEDFIIDMTKPWNWPWPIEDHEKYLEMERKLLQDEDFAEDLRYYFKNMPIQDVCLLFGNDIQDNYSIPGKGRLNKIEESPLLMCVANSWANDENPVDEVVQKINAVFCQRQTNCNRNRRRAENKAAEVVTSVFTDEDMEWDSDTDVSSIDEMDTTHNIHWPISEHERFLELEKKMLNDGAFVEDLSIYFKRMPHKNIDLLFGNDIQDKYSYHGRGLLIKISDSPLLMCVANSWTDDDNSLNEVLKKISDTFGLMRMNNSKKKFNAKVKTNKVVRPECADVDRNVEIQYDSDKSIDMKIHTGIPAAATQFISQSTEIDVNPTTIDSSITLEEIDEEDLILESISFDDIPIILECDSELGVSAGEVRNWEEEWPIESYDKFLEVQKKIVEEPNLKDILKLHLKAVPNKDLKLFFGRDILVRYSLSNPKYFKIADSPLLMCVAKSWSDEDNIHDMLKYMSKSMIRARKEKPLNEEEKVLEEMIMQMKLFVCKICDVDYGTYNDLIKHVCDQHEDQFDGYELCCKFSLKRSKPDLFDHIRLHLNDKSFKCQECGKYFIDTANLVAHERQFHTNSTSCICDTCGKGFSGAAFLNKHILMAHGPKYKCEYCQAELARLSSYKNHVWQQHEHVVNFICEICGKGYATKSNLNIHIKDHGGPHGGKRKKKPRPITPKVQHAYNEDYFKNS